MAALDDAREAVSDWRWCRVAGRPSLLRDRRTSRFVDADVPPAGRGVRLTSPAAPPFPQPEPGDPGHQVELGRVRQPQADRGQDDPVGTDPDVVQVEDLGHRVVPGDAQRDMAGGDVLGVDELVAGPGGSGRNPALEDEHALGIDAEQNRPHYADPISCPVLAVGAQAYLGDEVSKQLAHVARDGCGAVIPASGHNIALENPAALAQAYLDFFAGG
jgi:pimeloyl-ACP methyl ester carboxylesterase